MRGLFTEMAQAATCTGNRDPASGRDVDAFEALVHRQALERAPFACQVEGARERVREVPTAQRIDVAAALSSDLGIGVT